MPRFSASLDTILRDKVLTDLPTITEPRFGDFFPAGLDQHVASLKDACQDGSMTLKVDADTLIAVMDHLSGACGDYTNLGDSSALAKLLAKEDGITLRDVWGESSFKDYINSLTKTMTADWPIGNTWVPEQGFGESPRNDDREELRALVNDLSARTKGSKWRPDSKYLKTGFGDSQWDKDMTGRLTDVNWYTGGLLALDELKPFWTAMSMLGGKALDSDLKLFAVSASLPPGSIKDLPTSMTRALDPTLTYELGAHQTAGFHPEQSFTRPRRSAEKPQVRITIDGYDEWYPGHMDVILEFGDPKEPGSGLPLSRVVVGRRAQAARSTAAVRAASSLAWVYSLLLGSGTTPTEDNFESYLLAAREVARISKDQILTQVGRAHSMHKDLQPDDDDSDDDHDVVVYKDTVLSADLPASRMSSDLKMLWPEGAEESRKHLEHMMQSGQDGDFVHEIKTLARAGYDLAQINKRVETESDALNRSEGPVAPELKERMKGQLVSGLQACEATIRELLGCNAVIG